MQSTPFSNSTSSSTWNPSNNSNFWSNCGFRKRKAAISDLEEQMNHKMFVTEEKMVKEMQTLSLDLVPPDNNNTTNTPLIPNASVDKNLFVDDAPTTVVNQKDIFDDDEVDVDDNVIDDKAKNKNVEEDDDDDTDDDRQKETCSEKTRFELHKLLKDSLKNDDLRDSLIAKLCDIERRKLTMQIVPYVPIHPAQLNKDNAISVEKAEEKTEDKAVEYVSSLGATTDEIQYDNDDFVFKIPEIPTAYTVEEPSCDGIVKRSTTMKRSYSQSNESNSSFVVTELKPDAAEFFTNQRSQTAYFIVEPTANSLAQSSLDYSSSSLSSEGPAVRISELDASVASNDDIANVVDDDDIDMQSVASSDTGDKMDDD